MFLARSVIFANGTVYALTLTLSPKDLQEAEVFGGEGETRGDLDPGRRAKFLLRTLPWANVCCPFRALKGSSGVLPLLIQKMFKTPEGKDRCSPSGRRLKTALGHNRGPEVRSHIRNSRFFENVQTLTQ